MLNQPTSSPMMNRMLGFLSAAWSWHATAHVSAAEAISTVRLHLMTLRFMLFFLSVWFLCS